VFKYYVNTFIIPAFKHIRQLQHWFCCMFNRWR